MGIGAFAGKMLLQGLAAKYQTVQEEQLTQTRAELDRSTNFTCSPVCLSNVHQWNTDLASASRLALSTIFLDYLLLVCDSLGLVSFLWLGADNPTGLFLLLAATLAPFSCSWAASGELWTLTREYAEAMAPNVLEQAALADDAAAASLALHTITPFVFVCGFLYFWASESCPRGHIAL